MSSTLFCTTSMGPSVGDPMAMYAPPLRYKREALAVHQTTLEHTQTHAGLSSRLTQTQAIQHTVDVGYYAPAARTTLTGCVHRVLEQDRTSR